MTRQEELKLQSILASAYYKYERSLNSYAVFKLHDREMGKDLVQDSFMKAWLYMCKRGKIELMKAFLYHVLNDLIVDQYRKRKHEMASLDALLDKGFDLGADDTERLADRFDGKIGLRLIPRLPQKYQQVMQMRYVQDLSLNEMSCVTGQTKNTVAVQAHRGLKKLRCLYGSPFPNERAAATSANDCGGREARA